MFGCLFGHQWGEWQQDCTCEISRVCLRCNKRETKETHEFILDHYDDNCVEILVCKKCRTEKRGDEKHKWSKYRYYEDQCCTQVSICARCGATKYKEDVHNMTEYHISTKCEKITECVRCGCKIISMDDHVWNTYLHTYGECLEFVKDQVAFELDKIREGIRLLENSQERNDMDLTKMKIREGALSLEQSTIISRISAIKSDEEYNAPAKVCVQCRFISKTGKRVKRVDIKKMRDENALL